MADPTAPSSLERRDSFTQHGSFSIPPPRTFMPVTEGPVNTLSPRGQRLSQLIQNRAVSDPQRKSSFKFADTRGENDFVDVERATSFEAEQAGQRKSQEQARVSGDGRGIETSELPAPPPDFPLTKTAALAERRLSGSMSVRDTPMMRSQRLIGNSNPRYKW